MTVKLIRMTCLETLIVTVMVVCVVLVVAVMVVGG